MMTSATWCIRILIKFSDESVLHRYSNTVHYYEPIGNAITNAPTRCLYKHGPVQLSSYGRCPGRWLKVFNSVASKHYETIHRDWEDQAISPTLLTLDGKWRHIKLHAFLKVASGYHGHAGVWG